MKKPIVYLSLVAGSIGVIAWAGNSPQDAVALPYVRLQGSSPGTQQSGHINVSGTIIAGQHVGGGAGLTGVNADLLDGLNSTSFLQSVPNPLNLSGSQAGLYIIRGSNSSTTTGSAGVFGEASGTAGTTYGVYGWSSGSTGRGVYGRASHLTGSNTGGYFRTDSSDGTGVVGYASANSGLAYAGYFQASSTSGRGVVAITTATEGSTESVDARTSSVSGKAVHGRASASSGTTYGVYGEVTSPNGYGVYADGDLGSNGTKTFRIDHPFDPTGKYLLHYSTESPTPQNFYVGNATTDAKGYAWVELPDYFAEINKNFKYQLTVVDDSESSTFVQVKIGRKIRGNRFLIMSSAPNVEVSWRVDADRNDLYVRRKQPRDVIEKQGLERGTYQHPELYGAPPEKALSSCDGGRSR